MVDNELKRSDWFQELGAIVRYHRRKSGLTQSEIAKLAGIGKATVFDIEHGKKSIQLDSLHKMLSALNIKIELNSPLMESYRNEKS